MRRAVTLLEVLIAILVASVGLLGALAVFPVALSQAKKGQTADISAVAGESAIAAFGAQGMHEPGRWRYWDAANNQVAAVPPDFQRSIQPQFFGKAFCIDPMTFAHNLAEDSAAGTNNSGLWAWFPAVPESGPGANAIQHASRMHRVSLYNGDPTLTAAQSSPVSMSYIQADKVFRIEDELTYQRPDDNSLPAAQLFTDVNGQPGRRQEAGHLTWFATMVPKIGVGAHTVYEDRDGNGINELYVYPAVADDYILSVAVCSGRSGEALHVPGSGGPEQHPWNEWTAKILAADFHSDGIGGGEVTITTNDPADDPTFAGSQYLDLRTGQWILLGRKIPHPLGTIQHYQWYRVSDAAETIANGNRWSQDVSLVGGDWPADMAAPAGTNEECDVVIMPSVVHVYERTIHIAP